MCNNSSAFITPVLIGAIHTSSFVSSNPARTHAPFLFSPVRPTFTVTALFDGLKNNLQGMGGMMDAMKKAQEFTRAAQKLQEDLKDKLVEVESADGLVKCIYKGQQQPVSVEISEALLSQGAEAVNKSVTEAVILGHQKSVEYMKNQMDELTRSFGLPTGAGQPPGSPGPQ